MLEKTLTAVAISAKGGVLLKYFLLTRAEADVLT
jgi:hypothetical protein